MLGEHLFEHDTLSGVAGTDPTPASMVGLSEWSEHFVDEPHECGFCERVGVDRQRQPALVHVLHQSVHQSVVLRIFVP